MRLHKLLPESLEKMERIYDFISQKPGATLTAEEENILNRCNFADNALRNRHSDAAVIDMLMKRFEISKSTAYSDIATAKYVFNSLSVQDKPYGLKLLLDINMKCIDKCMLKGDYKTANALQDTRMKLLDRITETVDPNEGQNSTPSVFIMNVRVAATGRPRAIDLQKGIQELSDEEIEMIQHSANQMFLPENMVEFLKTDE
jgi:hypothetical protein